MKKNAGAAHKANSRKEENEEKFKKVLENRRKDLHNQVKNMQNKAVKDDRHKAVKAEINLRLMHFLAREKIANIKFTETRILLKETIKVLNNMKNNDENFKKILKNYKSLMTEIKSAEIKMLKLLENQIAEERENLENFPLDEFDDFTWQSPDEQQTKTEIEISKSFSNLEKKAARLLEQIERSIDANQIKDVDIGVGRANAIYHRQYLRLLASPFKKEVIRKLKTRNEFSLLIDTSVDTGKVDECALFVMTVNEKGQKENDFLGMIAITSGTAENIKNQVIEFFRSKGLLSRLKNCIFGIGTDGASNMRGCDNGFVQKMCDDLDRELLCLHCISHITALSAKFDEKSSHLAAKVDGILKEICSDFGRSALKHESLFQLQTTMHAAHQKILKYCKTRWLSRYQSCQRILVQLDVLLTFYENAYVTDRSKIRYLQICRYELLKGLHVLADVLLPIQKFQTLNQGRDKNVVTIMKELEKLETRLTKLLTTKGKWEEYFDQNYDENTHLFKGHTLKHTKRMTDSVIHFKTDYIKSTLSDLKSRTKELTHEISDFNLLTDIETQNDFQKIIKQSTNLCKKFKQFNLDASQLIGEISNFKTDINNKNLGFQNIQETSIYIHTYYPDSMQNLKQLYRLLLIFPFSTVLCESCFSHMAQIKNAFRNRLLPETLENLLFLTLNKDTKIDYQSLAYELIKTWKYEVENKAEN